ncbi:hypothetical protein QQS21_000559 [Conoideocrella luteorostrata]|uniref:AB hydrolase-1 domain-containing protein n=1 Tax=Conoideocrella luteorostrata TaxID=1105319 RepID=A0AAJ0CYP0_9HYPO|nr:hypothetical protein QQS21_000559 [Conoideocrella luteorostrata]
MSSHNGIAVVICHGSYHSPAFYQPLLDKLRSKGIDGYCPQLPTADLAKLNVGDVNNPDFNREPPAGGYPQGDEDEGAVACVLKSLIQDQRKTVLLVAHSSGGWVATQAAKPEFQSKMNGSSAGIIGILYMGAFIVPLGESITSFFQPKDGTFVTPPFLEFHKYGGAGLGTIIQAEKFLFNDMDQASAQKWAARLTASPILTTKLTNNAYADLPCAYLVLEGDMTLPKEYQEGMVARQAKKTGEFAIYRSPAGHSAHLSWTDGVVDTVEQFLSTIGLQV